MKAFLLLVVDVGVRVRRPSFVAAFTGIKFVTHYLPPTTPRAAANSGQKLAAAASGGPDDLVDMGTLFSAIWRNAWLLALAALVATALGYVYAFHLATPMFRASASIVLEQQVSEIAELEGTVGQTEFESTAINTRVAIVQSQGVLEEVVDQLKLVEEPEFNPYVGGDPPKLDGAASGLAARRARAETISELRRALTVENVPSTFIVRISAMTSSPGKSQRIANTLVDVYRQNQVRRESEAARAASTRLETRVEALQDQLIAAEARIEKFQLSPPDSEERFSNSVQLERLTGEAEAIRDLYQRLLTRLKKTRLQEDQNRPDSYVLSYAPEPVEPARPRKAVILFFTFVSGGLAGLGLVLLRERLSDTLRTPADLEHATGHQLIGATPRLGRLRQKSNLLKQSGLNLPLYAAALEDIRANLSMMRGKAEPPKTIAIASALPNEGTTALALSLAGSFAEGGRRTLLIDTDLRQRRLSRQIAPGAKTGLVSLLGGAGSLEAAVTAKAAPEIDVLPCESVSEQPLDLLSSARFGAILAEARERYDTVVLETAPVLAVPDVRAVGRYADAIVFVAKRNATPARKIREALIILKKVHLEPEGVVMTHMRRAWLNRSRYKYEKSRSSKSVRRAAIPG